MGVSDELFSDEVRREEQRFVFSQCCAQHGTSRHLFDARNRFASNLTLLFDTLYTPSKTIQIRLEDHVRQQSSGLLQGVSKHGLESAICSVWFHKSNATSMELSLRWEKTPCIQLEESQHEGWSSEKKKNRQKGAPSHRWSKVLSRRWPSVVVKSPTCFYKRRHCGHGSHEPPISEYCLNPFAQTGITSWWCLEH